MNMKKKILTLGLVASVLVSTTACGNKYIKLGDYTGLTVEYTCEQTEVTEEDKEAALIAGLEDLATEVEDKKYKAIMGDTVNIDYTGLRKGKEFDSGNYDLELGSGSFIDGFEEGLVGAKTGDKKTLKLTFPDPYENNPDLAGKAATFKVTVNSITHVPTWDEVDDALIAEKTEDEYKTVEEYKEGIISDLESSLEDAILNKKMTAAWEAVLDNSKIKEYPEGEVEAIVKEMEEYYTEYAAMYGLELDAFIEESGSTKEEFDKNALEAAQREVLSNLAAEAIASKENLEITDKEYKEGVKKYTEMYGYETEKDFIEEAKEETIREELLKEKVQKFVVENCTLELSDGEDAETSEDGTSASEEE